MTRIILKENKKKLSKIRSVSRAIEMAVGSSDGGCEMNRQTRWDFSNPTNRIRFENAVKHGGLEMARKMVQPVYRQVTPKKPNVGYFGFVSLMTHSADCRD